MIKSRFLSFKWVVPKYHLLHKFEYLFTGYDAVKCEKFSVYARGSIPDRSYGQTMSQFCQWGGQRCRKSPILSSPFSWVIATYYISIIIDGLVMYKITFSRHLCWDLSCCTTWFTHFYGFKQTRNIYLQLFHHLTVYVSLFSCAVETTFNYPKLLLLIVLLCIVVKSQGHTYCTLNLWNNYIMNRAVLQ